ncbi:MAG: metallophosphoesterase [Candidatus Thorarchaeota archaeon]|jgi:putative phosphoesterase
MRIAAISDIHIRSDGKDEEMIKAINRRVDEIAPDVFVIAGDISHEVSILEETLTNLKRSDSNCLYVAGNHDVWFEEDKELGSLDKYSQTIGEVCELAGFIHLPDNPLIMDDIAIVGSMGWYDYSFKRETLDIPDESYAEKHWRGSFWRDYYAIDWSYTDKEVTELFNSKLQYDLDTLPDHVSTVIYVSHHLPFKSLTLYRDQLPWDFFSAFMGSESTGQLLMNDGRVVLSISGHSHIRKRVEVNGLTAMTVPLGYGRPPDGDFTHLVHSAIADIEIKGGEFHLHHFVEGDICEDLPYSF